MAFVKPIKTNNPICHVCKKPAKINSDGKWWCKINVEIGEFNSSGFCKEKK
jgi:hypothetical protein